MKTITITENDRNENGEYTDKTYYNEEFNRYEFEEGELIPYNYSNKRLDQSLAMKKLIERRNKK